MFLWLTRFYPHLPTLVEGRDEDEVKVCVLVLGGKCVCVGGKGGWGHYYYFIVFHKSYN